MLFLKEIKKSVLTITFAVFLVALIAMSASQDVLNFSDMIITAPQQGEDYGIQMKEVPELIMPAAFDSLCAEFNANEYVAYPVGFYKIVKLNESKCEKMAEIISELSDVPADNILGYYTDNNEIDIELTMKEDISYETFKTYMRRADDLIGGGSQYSDINILNFSYVAISYDEAVERYDLILESDHFTGAYARLFCDYVGILISILPVFISVTVCLRDSRTRMRELIYARHISSFKLIFARFLAVLTIVIIPTVILAYISNISVWSHYDGMMLDYFAPLKYVLGWLLPSAMIAIAVGMFFTELTDTPIAIAIQGLWWFIDINTGVNKLRGDHNLFELTPRHNSLGSTQIFLDEFNTLTANRLIIAGIALLFVTAAIFVYEQKRRGISDGYEKFKKQITSPANRNN